MLLSEPSADVGLHIVAIVGMGGIGKTTLAQLAYNNQDVEAHFEKKVWVCVSDPFDEIKVAKSILESLTGSTPNIVELESLLQGIRNSVSEKKYLLVLDDVWTGDYEKWDRLKTSLKYGAKGSRILVTTRSSDVAKKIGTAQMLQLHRLSEEKCWSLFRKIAFFGRSNEEFESLKDLGHKIAEKCQGLPLAAKSLGSLMRFKERKSEWENCLNSWIWSLEEDEERVFSSLRLSYYDLPSAVQRCFTYCASYPKDYAISKDDLICKWMAQGYLISNQNIEMEEIGEQYFNILATRSFFQDFHTDYNGFYCCKMHDIVHDFALYMTKGECIDMECDVADMGRKLMYSGDCKARHVNVKIMLKNDPLDSFFGGNGKQLHTVKLDFEKILPTILKTSARSLASKLLDELKYVRTLDFSHEAPWRNIFMFDLPENVGKLIHLRYLNLSYNIQLFTLPESLCELFNLETLNITRCISIKRLPKGMRKLIKLRHLLNDRTEDLRFLPKGLEFLKSLRTLRVFGVAWNGKEEAASLGDLELLNDLHGSLTIKNLGNVRDAEDAKNAQLQNKKHLDEIILRFGGNNGEGVSVEMVLEALRPPSDLKSIQIRYYKGATMFPNWLMSLSKLTSLNLDLREMDHFPPLGKLHFLENLFISYMKVKSVGVEFLGIDSNSSTKRNEGETSLFSSSVVAFPALKNLHFDDMENLEAWDFGMRSEEEDGGSRSSIMPKLSTLTFKYCSKLYALPHHLLNTAPVEYLFIYGCPMLKERYEKNSGEEWHAISHISTVEFSFFL